LPARFRLAERILFTVLRGAHRISSGAEGRFCFEFASDELAMGDFASDSAPNIGPLRRRFDLREKLSPREI